MGDIRRSNTFSFLYAVSFLLSQTVIRQDGQLGERSGSRLRDQAEA